MPLPKPPAKRASLLSAADFDSQAAPKPRNRPQKVGVAAEPASPPLMELMDSTPALAPARPTVQPPAVVTPPPAVRARSSAGASARKPRGNGPATLFVLDTNVLMHDPTSLFRFDEHDIYLPMITLEELDGHKKGIVNQGMGRAKTVRDSMR